MKVTKDMHFQGYSYHACEQLYEDRYLILTMPDDNDTHERICVVKAVKIGDELIQNGDTYQAPIYHVGWKLPDTDSFDYSDPTRDPIIDYWGENIAFPDELEKTVEFAILERKDR
ncbi:MAG: hypothetical protein ACI4OH_05155 [Mitsuokella sp.]|uniref:hypothetical protein n=1 Tax=Mitsuokella sp. TaxID=2049034 RepID=UPI003F02439A